jgi:hypothetical protein
MTKKDYVLIAQSIWRSGFIPDKNQVRQQAKESMRRLIAIDLASSLKHENAKFDRAKFMETCGFGGL